MAHLVENYLHTIFMPSNVVSYVKGIIILKKKRVKCHSSNVEMHSRCHPTSIQL